MIFILLALGKIKIIERGENDLKDQLSKSVVYCIELKYLFSSLIPMIKEGTFSIGYLGKGEAEKTNLIGRINKD